MRVGCFLRLSKRTTASASNGMLLISSYYLVFLYSLFVSCHNRRGRHLPGDCVIFNGSTLTAVPLFFLYVENLSPQNREFAALARQNKLNNPFGIVMLPNF
jgi:hypothetical protein